jgi:hypothetical protein
MLIGESSTWALAQFAATHPRHRIIADKRASAMPAGLISSETFVYISCMGKPTPSLPAADRPLKSAVVSKAVLRSAERLGVSNRLLGRIVGLSEASVSRMARGQFSLEPDNKPYELSLLFIRLFRSLDSIVGGDETTARAWLRNENLALGGRPIAMIETVSGLVNVLAYLDAERAVV